VTKAKYNAHTEPLYKRLNILKCDNIYTHQILKFLHKIVNKSVPEYFQNFEIVQASDKHSYNTRKKNQLVTPFHRRILTENCIRVKLTKTFNNTDRKITEKLMTHCLGGFAQYVKKTITQSYSNVYTILVYLHIFSVKRLELSYDFRIGAI